MKTYIDTEAGDGVLDSFELKFDERDAALGEEARAIILAAHTAGLASARALLTIRAAYPDAPADAKDIAPQIFAQALGASLGLIFGEATPALVMQVLACARLATLSPEDRDATFAKLADAVRKASH